MKRSARSLCLGMVTMLMLTVAANAEETVFEDFQNQPAARWEFLADTVMGGVSTGQVTFETQDGQPFARMTGQVSTDNRGGFIQFRRKLTEPPPDDTKGIRLVVRGNDQRYFVHLRTSGTVLPWQYYQAGFDATGTWTEFRIPLSDFKPSGRILRSAPLAAALRSIGVVAYGRDHEARIDVREIGFY